ncbi:MAG TPA: preprotein translocase subunit SecE [Armatimonadetes bacterium]|nr:preprotein translocase subunit SecE [Armatimonadota bacterium]
MSKAGAASKRKTGTTAKPKKLRRVVVFLRDVRAELKKVQWPDWPEVWTFTIVVVLAVGVIAIYIGLLDFILSRLLRWLGLY